MCGKNTYFLECRSLRCQFPKTKNYMSYKAYTEFSQKSRGDIALLGREEHHTFAISYEVWQLHTKWPQCCDITKDSEGLQYFIWPRWPRQNVLYSYNMWFLERYMPIKHSFKKNSVLWKYGLSTGLKLLWWNCVSVWLLWSNCDLMWSIWALTGFYPFLKRAYRNNPCDRQQWRMHMYHVIMIQVVHS